MNLNPMPGFDPDLMRMYNPGLPQAEGFYGLQKSGDGSDRKPVYRAIPHCDIFDLEDEAQRKRYEEIMQMAADGRGRIIDAMVKDHPTTGHFRAVVHWAESVLLPPGTDSLRPSPVSVDEAPNA
jgi:hypothetical protein